MRLKRAQKCNHFLQLSSNVNLTGLRKTYAVCLASGLGRAFTQACAKTRKDRRRSSTSVWQVHGPSFVVQYRACLQNLPEMQRHVNSGNLRAEEINHLIGRPGVYRQSSRQSFAWPPNEFCSVIQKYAKRKKEETMSDNVPQKPTHSDIAERAYQIFERRNHEHGHNQSDWEQAEKELQSEYLASVKSMSAADAKPEARRSEEKAPEEKRKSQSA